MFDLFHHIASDIMYVWVVIITQFQFNWLYYFSGDVTSKLRQDFIPLVALV